MFRYKASILIENGATKNVLNWKYEDYSKFEFKAKELNINFKDYLINIKPYLTTDQCLKMKSEGFHFGGHSLDHPIYYQLSEKNQIFQTLESVNITKSLFNESLSTFAFPFTDFNVKKSFFDEIHKTINPTL